MRTILSPSLAEASEESASRRVCYTGTATAACSATSSFGRRHKTQQTSDDRRARAELETDLATVFP